MSIFTLGCFQSIKSSVFLALAFILNPLESNHHWAALYEIRLFKERLSKKIIIRSVKICLFAIGSFCLLGLDVWEHTLAFAGNAVISQHGSSTQLAPIGAECRKTVLPQHSKREPGIFLIPRDEHQSFGNATKRYILILFSLQNCIK